MDSHVYKLKLSEDGTAAEVPDMVFADITSLSSTADSSSESMHTDLSTPFSSRGSPDIESLKNVSTDEPNHNNPASISYYDLTRTGFSKHNLILNDSTKAEFSKMPWTKGEIIYLFKQLQKTLYKDHEVKPAKFLLELPLRKLADISKKCGEIQRTIEREIDITSRDMDVYGEWSYEETALLFWVHTVDLTWQRLKGLLPAKSAEQVRGKLLQISGNVLWTTPELNFLEKALKNNTKKEDLLYELPLRTASVISSRSALIRKKSRLSQFLIESGDLTRDAISKAFPTNSIDSLKSLIVKDGLVVPTGFTANEMKVLKEYDFADDKRDALLHRLPFRSAATVENELKKLHPYAFDEEFSRTKNTSSTPGEDKSVSPEEEDDNPETKNQVDDGSKQGEPKKEDIRRRNFKSSIDELVYYAKWFASDKFSPSSRRSARSKRSRAADVSQDLLKLEEEVVNIPKKIVKAFTPEELEERRSKWEAIKRRREEKAHLRRQKVREEAERRKLLIAQGLLLPSKRPTKTLIDHLKEEADYFQSVTGNFKPVEEGERRARKQTQKYEPEFSVSKKVNERQRKKALQLKLMKENKRKLIKKKVSKAKRPKKNIIKHESESEESEESETEEEDVEEEEEEEEQEHVSPFDPYDINTDTVLPLHNRDLYVSEIRDYNTYLPDLKFVDSHDVIRKSTNEIPYIDQMAADVVLAFYKSYNDLPISFPPLTIPSTTTDGSFEINPLNKIRLRYLLYPQHSELFILAEPKREEIDPIMEMQKLFQIHYALYFSHSDILKEIIVKDYCRELDESIENNDFPRFMTVVDKWNTLMIKLTPNVKFTEHYEKKDNDIEDINKEVRIYLQYDNLKPPTDEDLKLKTFLEEISGEANTEEDSPMYELIKNVQTLGLEPSEASTSELNEVNLVKEDQLPLKEEKLKPTSAVLEKNYVTNFFRNLNTKQEISRFCMHQLLLQVYSRVVSPDSQKLRSYKAFTAEVYGELLPSFTSEVLTKVELKPTQKFYDLGSGVGNTTFQAALEFGAQTCGGCELMEHASKLTELQEIVLQKKLSVFGLKSLPLTWALKQSFVDNPKVKDVITDCDVIIVNNYLFDANLNSDVGRLLYGLKPGTKIISLRNFIRPRYKAALSDFDKDRTIFDYLSVEKHEMSDFLSVSWTANKVPYYISTVQDAICTEYL